MESIISSTRNVRRRAAQALSAQLALRVIVVAQQILLTPLFLSRWGVNGYAAWVAASAVASFASLANVGLGQAASAEIIFKIQRNDRQGVVALFSSAISLLLGFSSIWIIFSVLLVSMWGFGNIETHALGAQGRDVVFLLNIVLLFEFVSAPFSALLGAALGAGYAVRVSVVLRALETLICVVLLYFVDISQLGIAIVMVLSFAAIFVTLVLRARREYPWVKYQISTVRWTLISKLIAPSLNFFILFASVNIVGIQLPRLVIFSALDASALALFTTMTTYFRTIRSICAITPAALQIEATLAHSGGEVARLKRIYTFAIHSAFWLSTLGGGAAFLVGPWIFPLWTKDLILFDWHLGLLLFLGVLCSVIFDAVSGVLKATNSLGRMPAIYLALVLIAMIAGLLFTQHLGLDFYAAVLLVPEVVGIILASYQMRAVTKLEFPWRSLLQDPPWHEISNFVRAKKGL